MNLIAKNNYAIRYKTINGIKFIQDVKFENEKGNTYTFSRNIYKNGKDIYEIILGYKTDFKIYKMFQGDWILLED